MKAEDYYIPHEYDTDEVRQIFLEAIAYPLDPEDLTSAERDAFDHWLRKLTKYPSLNEQSFDTHICKETRNA